MHAAVHGRTSLCPLARSGKAREGRSIADYASMVTFVAAQRHKWALWESSLPKLPMPTPPGLDQTSGMNWPADTFGAEAEDSQIAGGSWSWLASPVHSVNSWAWSARRWVGELPAEPRQPFTSSANGQPAGISCDEDYDVRKAIAADTVEIALDGFRRGERRWTSRQPSSGRQGRQTGLGSSSLATSQRKIRSLQIRCCCRSPRSAETSFTGR